VLRLSEEPGRARQAVRDGPRRGVTMFSEIA